MFSTGNNIRRKRTFVKWGDTRNASHNVTSKDIDEDFVSSLEQNYGNKLLSLRAALNEKELQLVELREQHISVVNRAAIARKNWEDAITSKDQVIVQLQKALHFKKCELDRQERVNEENVRRLLHKQQEEENAELVQKQRTISLLEQKNAQFVEELVEQHKTITKLKRQLDDKERQRASYLHKMEVVTVRVQDLKAALQQKEEAVETQKKYCQDLKGMVWKRDAMIGQLQLAEQELHSSVARQEAEHEALQCLKDKLQEEKFFAEKNLAQFKENQGRLDSEAPHKQCDRGLQEREMFLRKQRRQIYDLQKTLQSTEMALIKKHEDEHHLLEENKRLVHTYESLKRDFEHAQRKQHLLELDLNAVQERLSTAERCADYVTPGKVATPLKKIMVHRWVVAEAEQSATVENTQRSIYSEDSITEDQASENGVDDFDAERQSMASIGSTAMKMVSRAGNISNGSKSHSTQTSVLMKGSSPTFHTTRDRVSFKTRERIPGRLQTLRNLSSGENDHVSTSECTKIARNLYPSTAKAAIKPERKAWTTASTVQTQLGTNVHLDGSAEARTSILSESSQRSSPCAKVGLDSSSEIDGTAGGERSSTSPETFQILSLAKKKTTSLSSMCKSSRNACTEDSTSQVLPSTNHHRSAFFAASDSMDIHTKWMCQDLDTVQPSGDPKPLFSAKESKLAPKLKIPRCPEQSEISESSSLEFQNWSNPLLSSKPKAGTSRNHGSRHSSSELSRSVSAVPRKMFKTVVSLPAIGPQYQQGRSSKFGEGLKPPTPAFEHIQDSCDTALKSLQEEVKKREKSWRRTEASMRAALCQRLKDLKDAEKLNLELIFPRIFVSISKIVNTRFRRSQCMR